MSAFFFALYVSYMKHCFYLCREQNKKGIGYRRLRARKKNSQMKLKAADRKKLRSIADHLQQYPDVMEHIAKLNERGVDGLTFVEVLSQKYSCDEKDVAYFFVADEEHVSISALYLACEIDLLRVWRMEAQKVAVITHQGEKWISEIHYYNEKEGTIDGDKYPSGARVQFRNLEQAAEILGVSNKEIYFRQIGRLKQKAELVKYGYDPQKTIYQFKYLESLVTSM